MANSEREFVGRGKEHTVVRSKHQELVLKRPRFLTVMSIMLSGLGFRAIRNEFAEAEKLVEGTNLQIIKPRIFPFGHGYIISQKYIEPNCQTPDLSQLKVPENSYIGNRLLADPHNFRCKDNITYWLDPGKGPVARLLDHYGILHFERLTRIKAAITKICNFSLI